MSAARRPSLARDSGRTLVGAIVSNACNVLVILVIARALGIAAIGIYTLAFALRALLLLVCGLGMRASMTRFVAAHLARKDVGGVRGSVLLGVAVPFGFSLLVMVGWIAVAEPLAVSLFDEPRLVVPMRLFALSLPLVVVIDTALAATQGFSDLRAYVWVGQVIEPGVRLALTAVLLLLGGGIVAASMALVAASALAAVLAIVALTRMLARLPAAPATYPARELASFAATSWVASMATQGLLWADVVILGILVTAEEVGAYQVAARVVLVAMVVITAFTAAMAPRIASAWEHGNVAEMTTRYVGIVLWSARLTWPLLAAVVAVPSAVLHVFGNDFGDATTVILVLSVGAAAEVVGAPSSVLLNQIGRNRLNMVINVSALVVNVGLNFAVIPVWGIEGAATVWAFTMVAGAIVRVIAVRRVATGRWPWGRQMQGALAGALLAAAAASGLGRLLPDVIIVQLLAAGVVVATVFGLVVVSIGLNRRERDELSRQVSLQLPTLRRWRVQWQHRHALTSDGEIALDELISPFRADVLARAELFRLARELPDLRRDDEPAFLARARAGAYGVWFEEVLVHRGHVPGGDPATVDRAFRSIVRASLQLLDRQERLGRAALGKVSVTRVPAGTELGGWALAEDRWVLLDGGHRMGLALLDGVQSLGPGDYVVVPGATPPNNTERLLDSGRLDEAEALAFLARGLVAPERRDEVGSWDDLLDLLVCPANRVALEAWSRTVVSR